MRDNFNMEKLKKEQVNKIKAVIEKIVNDNKEYYKDKEYAKTFINNKKMI